MYQHIMVCIDFSEAAPKVLQRARETAQHHQAQLIMVHVVEYIPPLDFTGDATALPHWVIDEKELQENARHHLQGIAQENDCTDLERIVASGIPHHEIIQVIEERKIDLLVIGSHGRHGLQRLLGSTAHALLNLAPCDILMIRLSD
jgi:universal stress protein A